MDSSRLASLERSIRLLKTWSIILTTLVLLSLAANAIWVQAAAAPPVHVLSAASDDLGGGGSASTTDLVITPASTTDSPLTLRSVTTSNLSPDHDHICMVTASALVTYADPSNPQSAAAVFGLSIGSDIRLIDFTERTAHLVATADPDSEFEEVTTTFAFSNVRRDQTIRFSARWLSVESSTGNLNATTSSMTVACIRNPI